MDYNTGYCGGENGKIQKTTNGGLNWFLLQTDLTTDINSIYFVNKDTGYACGDNGKIIKTTNGGLFWYPQISTIGNKLNCAIFTSADTGYVFGSNGTILKTVTAGDLIGINKISKYIPDNFTLHQNYPNPFNPKTKIKFQISKLSDVKLNVYDVLGRKVATLVNEKLKAGTYEVEFDARHGGSLRSLPSGVYFYTLITMPEGRQAESFKETKKMLLTK